MKKAGEKKVRHEPLNVVFAKFPERDTLDIVTLVHVSKNMALPFSFPGTSEMIKLFSNLQFVKLTLLQR